ALARRAHDRALLTLGVAGQPDVGTAPAFEVVQTLCRARGRLCPPYKAALILLKYELALSGRHCPPETAPPILRAPSPPRPRGRAAAPWSRARRAARAPRASPARPRG